MKFQYDCEKLLGCDQDGIAILEPSHKEFIKLSNYMSICELLDAIGNFSSIQRGLKTATTSADKFFDSVNYKKDKLFIKAKENCIIGFLRVGVRYLYLREDELYFAGESYCVLDFYVYHSLQKQGQGKILFDKMLRFLNTQAYKLAYDNPTQAILKFLYKHYSLIRYIKQNNNFIVYPEFFKGRETSEKTVDYNYVLNHQSYKVDKYKPPEPNSKRNFMSLGEQVMNTNRVSLIKDEPYNKSPIFLTPQITKTMNNLIIPTNYSNPTLNLINSNPDKRFYNYFLNNDSTNSIVKSVNINPSNAISPVEQVNSENRNKFNGEIYLKNMIEKRAKEIVDRQERMRDLETKAYRNPSPNFYSYQKKCEFATVFQSKKLN